MRRDRHFDPRYLSRDGQFDAVAQSALSIRKPSLCDAYHPPNLVSNVVNGPDGPVSYSLGNGLSVVFGYDSLGRQYQSSVCTGASPNLGCTQGAFVYGYDAYWSGNRVASAQDSAMSALATYGYDQFNRLSSAQYSKWYTGAQQNFAYSYDRYGNRWSQTATAGSGPQPQFSFNAGNQAVGYTYDAAGNMTSDGTHTYSYDADGNLAAVDGGSTAKYTYDALNRRVRADAGGVSAEFRFHPDGRRASVWDGGTLQPTRGQYYWGAAAVARGIAKNHHRLCANFALVNLYLHRKWLAVPGQ